MLDLLIKLLSPIFLNIGVSQTDINTYVYQLGGFIYAILGTLVLAVVVIVVSQFVVKKGKRHLVSWGAALSWVLIVTILVNVICFGPMYNWLRIMVFCPCPTPPRSMCSVGPPPSLSTAVLVPVPPATRAMWTS